LAHGTPANRAAPAKRHAIDDPRERRRRDRCGDERPLVFVLNATLG